MSALLEKIGKRLLEGTRTGFTRHPGGTKYNGFTCPECGRHEFGTSNLPNGISIGHCHGNEHSGNGCTFKWDRTVLEDEKNTFYTMTREEWMSTKQA